MIAKRHGDVRCLNDAAYRVEAGGREARPYGTKADGRVMVKRHGGVCCLDDAKCPVGAGGRKGRPYGARDTSIKM